MRPFIFFLSSFLFFSLPALDAHAPDSLCMSEGVRDRQRERQSGKERDLDQCPLSIFGRYLDVGRENGGVMM